MIAAARICMLGSIEQQLRQHLISHPRGHERAAAVLFRRHSHDVPGLDASDRYVAIDFVPFDEDWITSSSSIHVDFDVAPLRELFRRCEEEGLVFGFAHNHPGGYPQFSDKDDENEMTLMCAIGNRNGPQSHLVALLLSEGKWFARTRNAQDPAHAVDVRHVLVLGDFRLHLHAVQATDDESAADEDVLARQAAAFGKPFVSKMRSLRIGLIGSSGTGSPTGTLLARAGIGEIVVVDPDKLGHSNLNRIRGARKADVGKNKAQWLREYLFGLDLGTGVGAYESYIDLDADAFDALTTCDVIFGCSDDQIGREVLNAACYMYALPYIDVGLGGWIDSDCAGEIRLRGHYGRVSTIFPEGGDCLHCQGIVSAQGVRREYALRENPDLSDDELRERYLLGGGEQAPGVGPFTSAVGDYGVATLFDLIAGFRRWRPELRRDQFLIDFVLMELRSPESKRSEECSYCGTGDFLLKRSKYRLGRPSFGVHHVNY